MKVTVKIIDGKGYFVKGSIGRGFGAWGRAGSIKVQLGLSDLPTSLPEKEWAKLTADKIVEVETERKL
jgi:hypothetical protein